MQGRVEQLSETYSACGNATKLLSMKNRYVNENPGESGCSSTTCVTVTSRWLRTASIAARCRSANARFNSCFISSFAKGVVQRMKNQGSIQAIA